MKLKHNCLGRLPLSAEGVQEIYDIARRMTNAGLAENAVKMIRDLALSHEHLRAELTGLQLMYDELDRKVRHGCTDARCGICEGVQE